MPRKPGQVKEGYKRMTLNVPGDLHQQFKTTCVHQGTDMTRVLLAFIEDYVRRHLPAALRKKGK